MFEFFMVFLGGSIGAGLRYIFSQFASELGFSYPGTFFINIIGSLFLGFIAYIAIKKAEKFHSGLKLFLTTGIAGGFTTFSAFSYEVFKLIQINQIFTAIIYIFSSIFFGLLAVILGILLAKQVFLLMTADNFADSSVPKLVNKAEGN